MLRGDLGQASCVYVSVKDVARALFSLGILRSPLHGSYDDEVATAYGEWYDSSGIGSFFGLRVSSVADTPLVQVCPTEAWIQLEAQAHEDAAAQEGPVAGPTSSVPAIPSVTITPEPPDTPENPPPHHVEAGTISVGWLFLLGGVAGFGTWLVMRKVY
jgi:hypothetical protein